MKPADGAGGGPGTGAEERAPLLNFTNVLILLGIIVTSIGVVYFAGEFIEELSEWGKLSSLLLLAVLFIALGASFEQDAERGVLVNLRGLRWLRTQSALYLIGVVSGIVAVFFFIFGMESIDARVKVLVTTLAGLALIVGATWARARGARDA